MDVWTFKPTSGLAQRLFLSLYSLWNQNPKPLSCNCMNFNSLHPNLATTMHFDMDLDKKLVQGYQIGSHSSPPHPAYVILSACLSVKSEYLFLSGTWEGRCHSAPPLSSPLRAHYEEGPIFTLFFPYWRIWKNSVETTPSLFPFLSHSP